MAVVRILGIDPGTQVVGFGCLECIDGEAPRSAAATPLAMRSANSVQANRVERLRSVEWGALRLGGRNRLVPDRLLALSRGFAELVARLQPDEVAIEEAFYGKSVQAALRIGEARGVLLAEAARHELAIHQYAPARIKRCVTGQGDASKESVARMVLRQLGELSGEGEQPPPGDATDALAVAMTRAEERRSPLLRQAAIAAAVDGRPVEFWPRRRRR